MTPPEQDHPLLHDHTSDRPLSMGTDALSVELADRHWREDNIGGWANDPRPLYLRIAEVLVANVLVFAACGAALLVAATFFD